MASGWRTFISWLEPIWLLGIDKVYGGGFCTVTEHERFYSYRRDKQTGVWQR
ncbi:laccase domain-containing protein [Methylobacter svalbardensis]|uniref:laccase domain-containing protein n=1 Tax=Methylobacter svalbardensis TaxID=3080016 RepID=UPI0030EE39A8